MVAFWVRYTIRRKKDTTWETWETLTAEKLLTQYYLKVYAMIVDAG